MISCAARACRAIVVSRRAGEDDPGPASVDHEVGHRGSTWGAAPDVGGRSSGSAPGIGRPADAPVPEDDDT